MKKRLLTVLLAVILVMALGTVTAFADGTIPANGGALSGEYKLTENTTVTSQLTVAAGTPVTIDLNGFTLSLSANSAVIKNEGKLTINDSSTNNGGAITGYRCVDNYGTLTINGGTFTGTNTAVGWSGCIFICSDNTSVTINEGTIKPDNDVSAIDFNSIAQMNGFSNTSITTLGGDIGDVALKGKKATLIVGNETGSSDVSIESIVTPAVTSATLSNTYTVALNGGTVGVLPQYNNVTYTATNSIITDDSNCPGGYHFESVDGGFKLVENTEVVATIGEENYYYVPDAVKALADGSTLKLLQDYNITSSSEIISITVPNVTIDLNGNDITVTGDLVQRPITYNGNGAGTLKITNSNVTPSTITPSGSVNAVYAASDTKVDVTIGDGVTLMNGIQLGTGARMVINDDNMAMLSNLNNLCTVTLGGTEYVYNSSNLTAIANDAPEGTESIEVTLLGNAANGIEYAGSIPMTVDLANFSVGDNISGGNGAAIFIPSTATEVSLTVENGTVAAVNAYPAASVLSENCTLTLNNINMTTTGDYGVAANGSKSDGLTLTLTNCTLTSTNNSNMTTGVFFPVGKGVLTIENSTITGYNTGVQAYAGTVTIRGADTEITGSGVSVPNIGDEGNPMATGPIFDGAAVSIIDRNTDYGEFVNISIEGGSFSTETGSGDNGAVHVASEVAGNAGSFEDFKNTNDDGDKIVQVSGGTFTSSVSEYVTDNLKAELYSAADGTYTYYKTTEEASAAAEPGDVVSGVTETAKYIVKVVYGNGAADTSVTVSSNATYILPGELVREGYIFQGWSDGTRTYPAGYSYTVTGNVTFTAVWKADRPVNLPDTHSIDLVVSDGGEAKLSLTNASEGATVTVTVTPDEGYVLDYITVDGERISGTSFTMPDHDVTVRVYFTDGAATLPFTDVASGAWYYDAVAYVYENGLMDGVSDTLFNPDGEMTRAMVWAILARLDGESVTGDDWAESAREWAVSEGVTDGENPDVAVTREMLVTMLWRYAGSPASSYSLDGWSDAADVSDWAADAMAWAIENGIITGAGEDVLDAQGGASRAQCAAILMRYLEG